MQYTVYIYIYTVWSIDLKGVDLLCDFKHVDRAKALNTHQKEAQALSWFTTASDQQLQYAEWFLHHNSDVILVWAVCSMEVYLERHAQHH